MKRIQINLAAEFPEVLATLLALPRTDAEAKESRLQGTDSAVRENGNCDAEVREAFRSLYEAANHRQVETQLGFFAIAPPVARFLKNQPYHVATQYEFFLEAFARILAGASRARGKRRNCGWTRDGQLLASRRGTNVPHDHPKRANRTVSFYSRATISGNNHR